MTRKDPPFQNNALAHGRWIVSFAFDPPALYLAGMLSSLLAVDPWDGRAWFARTSFRQGLALAIGFTAVALGCFAVAPDWMAHYRLDTPPGPGALALAGVLLYLGPFVAGYAIGIEGRRASRRVWLAAFLAGAALLGGVLAGTAGSLFRVGSRAEFEAGAAVPLWTHRPLLAVLAAGTLVLGAGLAAVLVGHRRRLIAHESRPATVRRILDRGQVAVVQRIAERLFPAIDGVPDHAGRWELGEEFGRYCADMPWIHRLGLPLAVDLIQYLPIAILGRPRRFTSLSPDDQDRYLERLSHGRWLGLQILFMVFKTGLSLLYYERPEVVATLGAGSCRGERRT